MPELAVIINHVGEYPHLHYTLQSVWMELRASEIDFEVICVDNDCEEAKRSGYEPGPTPFNIDDSMDFLTNGGKYTPWLRRLKYDKKLSHWSAKGYAVKNTVAPYLFFLDAHCLLLPAGLTKMFDRYKTAVNLGITNESYHLSISDFLRPDFTKKYKLLYEPGHGILHYENQRVDSPPSYAIDVPAQSTCGMLCRREHITDVIGYWPEELGPYGGGENYFNFCMALMGYKKALDLTEAPGIYHWHIPGGHWSRDYTPSVQSWARNIMIATYLVGGLKWLENLTRNSHKAPYPISAVPPHLIWRAYNEIRDTESLVDRREWIKARAVTTIEQWAVQWVGGECE